MENENACSSISIIALREHVPHGRLGGDGAGEEEERDGHALLVILNP